MEEKERQENERQLMEEEQKVNKNLKQHPKKIYGE